MVNHNPHICRARYFAPAIACTFLALPTVANAQSTPTELADLSFEDLLNLDIAGNEELTGIKRWSFRYSYRGLRVGRYKNGTDNVSFDDVLFSPGETRTTQNYPVVPTFIEQDVHAYSATYAVNDTVSLGITVPYISQSTDHISSVPGFDEFVLTTSGVGDVSLTAAYAKTSTENKKWLGAISLNLPTGSIDETGDTPRNGSGTLERLPYTMQLGSGTYDLAFSGAYSQTHEFIDFGLTANATIRTGENDNGYRLGDNLNLGAWSQYTKHYWLQPGIRFNYRFIEEINGGDASLLVPNPTFPFPASITDPSNFGGEKATAGFTLTTCTDETCKVSVVAEASEPFYQNLNGIQPKERYSTSLSVSAQF